MKSQKVHTGDVFGDRTVIEYRSRRSLCRCSCGREDTVSNGELVRGRGDRCNLCRAALNGVNRVGKPSRCSRDLRDIPHDLYARLYIVVCNAITRCVNPDHHSWKYYGGRGIQVCQEWLDDRSRFVKYLASLSGHDNPRLVLDREDNDGNYEPGNLRFVTKTVSARNRREYGCNLLHDDKGRFRNKT